jgi:hypothetical protein
MHGTFGTMLCLGALAATSVAQAAEDCRADAIATVAEVDVSDGSSYRVETYYLSADTLAVRFVDDNDRLFVVEGSISWARGGDREVEGSDSLSGFALGHQYHALLTRFAEIADGTKRVTGIEFAGRASAATRADFPFGGSMYLVDGESPAEAAGLLFEFPETPPIESRFLDWRQDGDRRLPYRIRIDDGDRVFDYRYTTVEFTERSRSWFYSVVGMPALDALKNYRESLAGACADD